MSDTSKTKILHAFADCGVEGEALAAYGDVHRYTIKPRDNPVNAEVVQMDLMEDMPDERFDFGLFHPNCGKWADTTNVSGDPADHDDQIPRAREIAEQTCEHYVIENKPRAPLRDPTVLNGKMFGLPIKYERAFETTFPVERPPRERELVTECSPYFHSDRTTEWWRSVKGYSGDYSKEHVAKNCLPAVYVHTLARSWLKAVNDRDAIEAQDNNSPAPPKVTADQLELTEVHDAR